MAAVVHNRTLLTTLEEGDMIEIPRGLYAHWAVYIGNGKVIHLTGDPNAPSKANSNALHIFSICGVQFDKAWVREDDLIEVAGDCKAMKNNDKDKKATALDRKTIMARAKSKLGEIGFNILWRNCEYFASWCRYGEGWSEQINSILKGLGLIAAIVGGVVIAAAVGGKRKRKELEACNTAQNLDSMS